MHKPRLRTSVSYPTNDSPPAPRRAKNYSVAVPARKLRAFNKNSLQPASITHTISHVLPRNTLPSYSSQPPALLTLIIQSIRARKKDEAPNPQLPHLRHQSLQNEPRIFPPAPARRRARNRRSRCKPGVSEEHSTPHFVE